MRLVYTLHSRKRMLERGIDEKDVESVLASPDSVEDDKNRALIASKRIGNKAIKIIYSLQGNKIIVITVC